VLLNDKGGVVDDLIVYRRANCWRAVVNAATRAKVLAWFKQHATGFDVNIRHRGDLAMIAVQGPEAIERFEQVTDLTGTAEMKPFKALERGEWMVARTGYTGEEGVEVMLPAAEGIALWKNLADARVAPCGLASRDTLRLEAGLNLYGQDMDETNDPLESNLAWTVALDPADRDFVGRAAVKRARPQAFRANSPVWCSMRKGSYGTASASSRMRAKARSPAVFSRRRWVTVSRWRACLEPPKGLHKWTSAANSYPVGSCVRRSFATARKSSNKTDDREFLMSEFPTELRYAKTHEWARLEEDGTVTIGISDHAQGALGDVVYVELPELDVVVESGEEAGVVESVKAASDIYAPIAARSSPSTKCSKTHRRPSIRILMATAGFSAFSPPTSPTSINCSTLTATQRCAKARSTDAR
jgi:hypothetical protein